MSTPEERLVEAMAIAMIESNAITRLAAAEVALTALLANRQDLLEVLGLVREIDPLNSVWTDERVVDEPMIDETGEEIPPLVVSRITQPAYVYRVASIPTSEPEEQS